jgi:hypothetical protein
MEWRLELGKLLRIAGEGISRLVRREHVMMGEVCIPRSVELESQALPAGSRTKAEAEFPTTD